MESGYPERVATLVGVVDGTTSLYFSNGGGVIGAGEHCRGGARGAPLARCRNRRARPAYASDEEPQPPATGRHSLSLSRPRACGAVAAEDDLGERHHELSPLLHAGHDVITQIRLQSD